MIQFINVSKGAVFLFFIKILKIMEEQNFLPSPQKSKSKYWKFAVGFFGVIIGILILYTAGFWAVYYYKQWQGQRAVQKLAVELERIEKEDYERAMADTYGGKTPQETLQMYIDAVEKGDYELASKYFIEEKREKELNSLNKTTKEFIDKYLYLLKKSTDGYFSPDDIPGRKEFFIDKPIYIRIGLYPNGIWKIIEI